MDRKYLIAIGAVVLLGAGIVTYVFLKPKQVQPVVDQIVEAQPSPPAPVPAPTPVPTPIPVLVSPSFPPLPQLTKSDSFVFDELASLLSNQSLIRLFHTKRIIRKIVATIVNLPEQRAPSNQLPFNPPSRHFLTAGSANHLTISPNNQNRYTNYMKIAELTDAKILVALYVHLYPLFQQSYEELGYHNAYFNDQLIETLDDLLETPDVKEPIKLLQPKYFYLFSNPDLEALSVGQKIMLRLGNKNTMIIKAKLKEIKQELALNMNGTKLRKVNYQ